MADLGLQPYESIMVQIKGASSSSSQSYKVELILTNLHLFHISKGFFGKVKGINKYLVDGIKVVDDRAQVFLANPADDGSLQLQIFFDYGLVSFRLQSDTRHRVWQFINSINQLLTGKPLHADIAGYPMALQGAGYLAEVVKDTIGFFRQSLGMDAKKEPERESAVASCRNCPAPLSGYKGQLVRCRYCNSEQLL
ncbi:MAG: hypothetical protein GX838_04000 [Clostridiaceae bacterium]|nr:hypothetical protein [Clostridiaceae bacterium]